MILRLRYLLLRLMIIPAGLMLAVTAGVFPVQITRSGEPLLTGLINHPWRFVFFSGSPVSAGFLTLTALVVIILVPILTDQVLNHYFKNSTATEILLYRLFLLLVPFHGFRVLSLLAAAGYLPAFFVSAVSRFDLFIHMSVLLTLFASSLFCAGISFSRLRLILVICGLIAAGFAVSSPMDETRMTGALIHLSANETPLSLLCLFLSLLTLINYGYAIYTKSTRNYPIMLLAIFLSIAGYEILYFFSFAGVMAGTGLILAGTYLYAREVYSIYLW